MYKIEHKFRGSQDYGIWTKITVYEPTQKNTCIPVTLKSVIFVGYNCMQMLFCKICKASVGAFKWRFVQQDKILRNVRTHVICSKKRMEYFVYHCLRTHTKFDVTCFTMFVKAWDVMSSVRSIRLFVQSPVRKHHENLDP